MRFALWVCLIAGAIASLALSYDVSLQRVVLGAREGRWTYFYIAPFAWYPLLIWGAAAALCVGLLRLSEQVDRHPVASLLMWFVAAVAIQGMICSLAPFRFDKIFASDGANSFNTVAQHYTPSTMLR